MEAIFVVDGEELILFSKKLIVVFLFLIDGSYENEIDEGQTPPTKKFIHTQTILHTLSSYDEIAI